MMLLTKQNRAFLLRNGAESAKARQLDGNTADYKPVVKFFTPFAGCTWLFTELDEDGDTLFGLCDMGMGFPELGSVSLNELTAGRGRATVERDRWFQAGDKTLSQFVDEAFENQRIMA